MYQDKGQEILDLQTLESGTDGLSRNVAKELPLYTAEYPKRTQIISSSCYEFSVLCLFGKHHKLCIFLHYLFVII